MRIEKQKKFGNVKDEYRITKKFFCNKLKHTPIVCELKNISGLIPDKFNPEKRGVYLEFIIRSPVEIFAEKYDENGEIILTINELGETVNYAEKIYAEDKTVSLYYSFNYDEELKEIRFTEGQSCYSFFYNIVSKTQEIDYGDMMYFTQQDLEEFNNYRGSLFLLSGEEVFSGQFKYVKLICRDYDPNSDEGV